jgi:uncharacterized GH25 family protein
MLRLFSTSLVIPLSLLWAATLQAHDFWIEPDSFAGRATLDVQVELREGMDMKGDTLPFIPQWFNDFSLHTRDGDEKIASIVGSDPAARVSLREGTNLIGYQSNPSFVALKPEKFNSYLIDEGMNYIIDQRITLGEQDEVAKEYFVRCAKSLLYGNSDEADDVYSRKLGYTLELIPENDRTSITDSQTLKLHLLFEGKPLADHRIRAFRKSAPEQHTDVRTNAEGYAEIPVQDSGLWLIKSVHMVGWDKNNKADWISYWASLTLKIDYKIN